MNYELIKSEIKSKGFTFKRIAEMVGMTEQGLNKAMKNNTMAISVLETICTTLAIPVAQFFGETKVSSKDELQQKVNELYEENRQLMKENKKLMEQVAAIKESKSVRDPLHTGKLEAKR